MADTLQVNQPNIEQLPQGNGWPTPLVDPSGTLKMAVTNGQSGSQKNIDPISTSQQDRKEHQLGEGQ